MRLINTRFDKLYKSKGWESRDLGKIVYYCFQSSPSVVIFIYIKYHKEDVIRDIESRGYIVIKYNSNSNIIAKDGEGYKYKLNYLNLLDGKKPSMLMRNPFATYNFKLYLLNNCPDYEMLDKEYTGCKTKMHFICHKHEEKGIQLNTPDNIINNNHICRFCGYEEMGKQRRINKSVIIKRCEELSLEYVDRISRNGESYILFVCPKHKEKGVQGMSWTHFKDCSNGCIYCGSSIGENVIRKELTNYGLRFEEQKTFEDCFDVKELRFDFYINDYNVAIEYDGQQHFQPVDFSGKGMDYANEIFKATKRRDNIKNIYCENNGIKLIRIPYTKFDNIHEILNNELMIENDNNIKSSETTGCVW